VRIALASAGAAAGLALGYGWFEAGWVRLRVREVELPRLPAELDGLRVAHLSDFHLGLPSRGRLAVERAVAWVEERRPELVCLTGDLLSRARGEPLLRSLVTRLPGAFVVLGNHDLAESRDPFSQRVELDALEGATLLADESRTFELRGRRVQVAGVDPRSYSRGRARAERLADADADLRILLCHFPGIARRLPSGAFDLVLAGHLHRQVGPTRIVGENGKVGYSYWRYTRGLYVRPGGTMHVSPGLGTTFVPFRFCARPEATELVLQSAA